MIKKKPLLFVLFLVLCVCVGLGATAFAGQSPQIPLNPKLIPKFVNQLPLLSIDTTKAPYNTVQTVFGNTNLTIGMYEFKAQVLPPGMVFPDNPATTLVPDGTTNVFGYVEGAAPAAGSIRDTYTGPVLVNARNNPFNKLNSTNINFVNNLGSAGTTNVLFYRYAIDQTLHWADPLGVLGGTAESNKCYQLSQAPSIPAPGSECAKNYAGPIAVVPHIHGGEVPAELDGGPDAWWTSTGLKGHAFYSAAGNATNAAIYNYPNTMEAAPIWFHDHLLGGTRLNVFAGLAGAYLIYDPALVLPTGLHFAGLMNGAGGGVEYTVPLVIQDRMFDTEGQFFYQSDSAGLVLWATNPEHPYWTPEFLGDVILVNGKAWPNLNVEPKRYRFWLINGSNARTYELFLIDPLNVAVPPNLWVIGTDGGYLDSAAMTKKLVIMPGERYEVIIDFAGLAAGTKLILKNTAKSPYPAGAAVQGGTTGQVMQFTIGGCTSGFCGATDTSYNPAVTPAIRPVANAIVRLPGTPLGPAITTTNVQQTRLLTLNEVLNPPTTVIDPVTGVLTAYPGGPLEILVNNTKYAGTNRADFLGITTPIPEGGNDTTYYSELPQEGTTEIWELVNLTADAHPIHLHLVQFQIVNRQNYDTKKYVQVYNTAFPTGVYQPGYGPPLSYAPTAASGNKYGGNPDVALYLKGTASAPLPQEAGWKDTVVAYPGQVTRIAVRWAPTDVPVAGPASALAFAFDPTSGGNFPHGWVWHCHIVDHEDNEMMRPFSVNATTATGVTRTVVQGIDF
jgi:spore coat protein A, manganese oxidase